MFGVPFCEIFTLNKNLNIPNPLILDMSDDSNMTNENEVNELDESKAISGNSRKKSGPGSKISMKGSFIDKNKDQILFFSIIVAYLSSAIPIVISHYVMELVLTAGEAYLAFCFFMTSTIAFGIAYYTVRKKKTLFYPMLYLLFHVIGGILIAALSFTTYANLIIYFVIWVIYIGIMILGLIAAKKSTSPERPFTPHLSNKRAATCAAFALIAIILPLSSYYVTPVQEYQITPLHDDPQNLEINFTLANLTRTPTELLEIMEEGNNLEHINISLTAGFLEEFVLNTTLLIGEEFIPMGDFIKPIDEYDNFEEYSQDTDEYEEYWNNFTKKVREAVADLSYEELLTNDSLYLTEDCLILDELRAYDAYGIAVDLMPLVEREVYINDYTIERINKTLTVMKKFVDINNVPHRGIVMDTERMWGQDDETLLDYYDREIHRKGIVELGKAIRDLKEYEWKKKGLDSLYGEFTEGKWQEHAVSERVTMVAGATFGLHVHDLWDKDDAQQNLFKISILAEEAADNSEISQLDLVGIMTYENQENSEHAVYGYCKAGDYFFGNRSVPYIYSGLDNCENYIGNEEDYINNLYRKFKIAQNYGYDTVGIWAFTNIYCFAEWGEGWCGGLYDFLQQTNRTELLGQMLNDLNNNWDQNITVTYDAGNYAMVTYAINLLDLYLPGDRVYNDWPINQEYTSRVRPEQFEQTLIFDDYLRIVLILSFLYFAIHLYNLSEKAKKEDVETKEGLFKSFSAFYLFTGLNFFFEELNLRYQLYPDIVPENLDDFFLVRPMDSDIFLILFILLSAIPMMYGLEKYLLKKKRFILTYLALIGTAGILILFAWHDPTGQNKFNYYFQNVVILYGWVMLGLLALRLISIYISLALKGPGPIRKLGLLMGFGFIILILGIVLTSQFPTVWIITGEAFGHMISLLGVILIYMGTKNLR